MLIYNDNLLDESQINITIHNRSFRYGDGLFESMRITGRKIPFLSFHWDRLKKGMDFLKIERNDLNPEKIFVQSERLIAVHSGCREARLRLSVFRNGNGLYTPENNSGSYLLEISPWNTSWGFSLNKKGLSISVFKEVTKPIHPLFALKSNNALIYILAGIFNKQQGTDDTILINEFNHLVESTSSSLFIIKNNTIYTPPSSDGPLESVMKKVIIRLCDDLGITLIEKSLKETDLLEADEVLLANATKGIQWVSGYQQKRYFSTIAEKLTSALNQLSEGSIG